MNIPIYRAKKIDSDEYVKGYYFENTNWKLDYEKGDTKFLEHYICRGMPDTTSGTYKVDPTTLSINFPDMLDSQGNKIFASLSEDGKGGDNVKYKDYDETYTMIFNSNGAKAINLNNQDDTGYVLNPRLKVIGIQK